MAAPIIGVTTFHSQPPKKPFRYHSVTEAYIQALVKAGAAPVLIPLGLPDDSLKTIRKSIHGILFTGGGDLDPAHYGGENYPKLDNVDPERDRTEIYLVQDAVQAGLPFLGICRGLQTINVALGGSLFLDIKHENPRALKHDCFETSGRDHLSHAIEVVPGSLLNKILNGTDKRVNSGHHQAAKKIGEGLIANALAPDGIVEGCELPDHPFGLAVQWHPEWLTHIPEMLALFQKFVGAAQQTI
jgi:putative glutamine amidotransferase